MGIGLCLPVRDPDTGKPTKFKCGSWFCYDCKRLLKTIKYPFEDTIEPCKCGCNIAYKME